MAMRWVPPIAAILSSAGVWARPDEYNWWLLDVPSVVCTADGAPGKLDVTINMTAIIDVDDMDTPHIFTFYRTSNKTVSVTFGVKDGSGVEVFPSQTVVLQPFARRLQEDWTQGTAEKTEEETAQEWEFDEWIAGLPSGGPAPGRRMAATRRRGVTMDGDASSTQARRRSSGGNSQEVRRRANPYISRRRGSEYRDYDLVYNGVGNSRYTNKQGNGYGYVLDAAVKENFPTGHTTTSYGYSGQGSYRESGTAATYFIAFFATGAAVGGTSYAYSRWGTYGHCSVLSFRWFGPCYDCYSNALYMRSCRTAAPDEANRDDVLTMGFFPADWKSPLTVTFTNITGDDMEPSKICPSGAADFKDSPGQDLFLTFTTVSDLQDELAPDPFSVLAAVLIAVGGCCFCGCLICIFIYCKCCIKTGKSGDDSVPVENGPTA